MSRTTSVHERQGKGSTEHERPRRAEEIAALIQPGQPPGREREGGGSDLLRLLAAASWARRKSDGNGYPKSEYSKFFTRHEINFLSVDILLGKILYQSGRRVQVWMHSTHTRLSAGTRSKKLN